jgi:uncharacterized protein YjiS (DUF1127 family)
MTMLFVPGGSRAALARRVGPGRVANWFAVLRAGGASCLSRLREYRRRHRSRVYIWQLDDSQLKDIGITRAEAEREGNKPFWLP